MIRCDTAIATVLTQSMTSLEEFSSFATASLEADFRLFEGLTSHLTQLSFAGNCGRYEGNNWGDWLDVIRHSKDTLHTLELDDMDDIPPAILKSALELIAPSLLRLFYGTRIPELAAVLLAALPTMESLISLRTSLPTTTALALVPPTVVELGMAHQSRYYENVQSDDAILRATLARSKHLPNLKVLWLPGTRMFFFSVEEEEKHGQLEKTKDQAIAEGMTWTLLTGRMGMLPRYGSEEEMCVFLCRMEILTELTGLGCVLVPTSQVCGSSLVYM